MTDTPRASNTATATATATAGLPRHTDILVVGAGILGIAHAVEAARSGMTVRVLERDARAVGASVRNFGHACVSAQPDELLATALDSREGWLAAASEAGIWAREAGAVVVARTPAELGLLEEFRDQRGTELVELLDAAGTAARIGQPAADAGIIGGAFLPADLRVDPRTAVGGLTRSLISRAGVEVLFRTAVGRIGDGEVATARGTFTADHVVVCTGHDLDQLLPDLADTHRVRRCALNMASADAVPGLRTESALLTGFSMVRYGGFSALPSGPAVAAELAERRPDLTGIDANIMLTTRPDGTVLLGDSHHRDLTVDPFLDEDVTRLLLDELASIVSPSGFRVRQRWQGVYASSPDTDLLVERVHPRTTVAVVTTGIGMTMSFGVARRVLRDL
ncbi:TIGR03364 family FAD-dependent oxidoreductase [Dietzia sp. E1]|uniref:TIGR03364 family FAD-dependent oxidoreductase n=1 Tax=Dietzia sp. E1 TaxID=328361 RepID=UPI0015FA839A|nr:TIGR03364 family FAD-dependent oxidoreductase [Dietzia sp. E1]MBB1020046.1 TIGR03364 family FAD-dependent oxidoreductase [Dietzia sp. E1]